MADILFHGSFLRFFFKFLINSLLIGEDHSRDGPGAEEEEGGDGERQQGGPPLQLAARLNLHGGMEWGIGGDGAERQYLFKPLFCVRLCNL